MNRRHLIAVRCAICNKDGADLLSCIKRLADEPLAANEVRTNWLSTFDYFRDLEGIVATAIERVEIAARAAGHQAERGGVMLKALKAAARVSALPADAYLIEGGGAAALFGPPPSTAWRICCSTP